MPDGQEEGDPRGVHYEEWDGSFWSKEQGSLSYEVLCFAEKVASLAY
jgi:hypothetical protein